MSTRFSSLHFATVRELRRRPARSLATIVVLALSVAAIGVLAVPAISSATLDDLAERDAMAHITLDVTPITDGALVSREPFRAIPGVSDAEARIETALSLPDGGAVSVMGIESDAQTVNIVDDFLAAASRVLKGGNAIEAEVVSQILGRVLAVLRFLESSAGDGPDV